MKVGWGLGKLTSATYLINIGTREQLLVGEFFSRDRLMMTLGCCLMPVNHSSCLHSQIIRLTSEVQGVGWGLYPRTILP